MVISEQGLPKDESTFNRRDFLKALSITGGALLMAGCTPAAPLDVPRTLEATLPPASDTPQAELTSTDLSTPLPTASYTPSPTSTPSLTPEPPPWYLPAADGSFSSFPLPAPEFPNFMPLAQALQERHSSRVFLSDELTVPVLASLLWAGFGVNRADGKRTAPSANNVQDITLYLATAMGMYLYSAAEHSLIPLTHDDLRPFTGTQEFVSTAPLEIIYVSDYRRMEASDEQRLQWSWAHTGCIAQNVYLACAALGLATVVRSSLNRNELAGRMNLQDDQHITLVQTVGFPVNQ